MDITMAQIRNLAASCHDEPTEFHMAACDGDADKISHLLSDESATHCVNQRNWLGCTPLRLAASGGHAKCVMLLLNSTNDLDEVDVKAQTSLSMAIRNSHTDCARLLLQAGANPEGSSHSLCSPLYQAAVLGTLDSIKVLVEFGAYLNGNIYHADEGLSSTPLYIAMAYGRLDCFQFLLLSGADPDMQDHGSAVPSRKVYSVKTLYHAAMSHKTTIHYHEQLYEFGANLYVTDDNGRKAWEIDGKQESITYLKDRASNPRSLLSTCRLTIRQSLGRKGLRSIMKLPGPPILLQYLNHATLTFPSEV